MLHPSQNMKAKKNKDIPPLIRSYSFVLQEVRTLKTNVEDFSLTLLWAQPEFIDSTARQIKTKHS